MASPFVLLHGFTQTGRSWDGVRRDLGDGVLAPDLRGHGAAAARRPIDTAHLVADVLEAAPDRFVLAGYSMGGRLALHVALAAPERVAALGLVSTTAGLPDPAERAARRAADDALAGDVERDGIDAFAERWGALPLWAGQPEAVRAVAHAERLRQDPAGLAASLRGFGTGAMVPVWDRLGELTMPAVVLAGARDAKFRAIGERLAAALPDGRLVVVDGAGHALALEAPATVAAALGALA
ncbi:alpha/beta fold hydrolase [Capillimicrobium parvum]|uniref:2-succinyl-6-hydroxy-2, 4-cyclohexadiene-1-carboxylate synthase n=1 Tax=Capillimicrobium parvum TaxID=2884022 RepID=A0A9E7C1B0_9ACTN|nr:alpha/beta fold hydrolase [Capillimicrobium parvum]UGS36253.1 2-succinyl-6-hydroxy-2,4-cyclohexadiene-1-carboxylate synthase [Capillimicrobium parvum]